MSTVTLSSLLTPEEAAERVRCKPGTLAKYRSEGTGPKFTKLGGLVRYTPEALDAWVQQCTVSSTSESASRKG
jgi:excisionase family DNA binding protein